MKWKNTIIILILFLLFYQLPLQAADNFYKLNKREWKYKLGSPQGNKEEWHSFTPGEYIQGAKEHKYVWFKTKLPDIKIKNPILYIAAGPGILHPHELYLQNKSIFKNGKLKGKSQLAKYIYSIVPLPQKWQNQHLYMQIYNNYHQISLEGEIIRFIGPYKNTIKKIFLNEFPPLILSLIYLILGLFALHLFFFKRDQMIYFYLGAGLISVFIYTITHNRIVLFLFKSITDKLMIIYYSNCFIMNAFLVFYFGEIITKKKKSFSRIGFSYLLAGVIALIFYLINPYSKIIGAKIYNLSSILLVGLIIYYLIKTLFIGNKETKQKIKILGIGISFLTIGALLGIGAAMSYQFKNLTFLKPIFSKLPFTVEDYTSTGIFLFILSLVYTTGKHFAQIKKLAVRDSLTNLHHHKYFQEQLTKEVNRAKRYNLNLSLLMLDIDNFKTFNDTYGHQAGDKILRELGQLLQKNIRQVDIAARYGGEEFILILPETNQESAYKIGKRLLEIIRGMNIKFKDIRLNITVSIGIASYQQEQTKKDLISKVDQALYQAKKQGKNQIVINNESK